MKVIRNELQADLDEDEVPVEDIIDEEELVLLKELKDNKRDYRENFSKLKGLKSELSGLQENINASKNQLIYRFEIWYTEEFEVDSTNQPLENVHISLKDITEDRNLMSSNDDTTPNLKAGKVNGETVEENFDDEDAMTYKRAKMAVDELHRARKFEKSIKLR